MQAGVRRKDYHVEDLLLTESDNLFIPQDAKNLPRSPINLKTFPIYSNTNSLGCVRVRGRER